MATQHEKKEFESWYRALVTGVLTPEQLAVLQTMVDDGQVEDLERAAHLLDWQETVLDPDEHMYGH